ncbi:MAG TPA: hypothetical protein VNA57_13855 [Acidimicrobiales bacterium]|nr:hypothetical protein [Acidimicrobiales bacterium]
MDDRRLPLATRVFVYGFLGVFLVTGLAGVEAWPLTGWKLFSRARTDRQVGWEAVTVDGAGREHPVRLSALPRSYRGGPHLFSAYRRFSTERIEEACRALVGAVQERDRTDARSLRVYRRVRRSRLGPGSRGRAEVVPVSRDLLYECGGAAEPAAPG